MRATKNIVRILSECCAVNKGDAMSSVGVPLAGGVHKMQVSAAKFFHAVTRLG